MLTSWRNADIIKLQVGETPNEMKGVDRSMYPNLLGQKAFNHLTDEDMGRIIGVTRNAYGQKMKSGRFSPDECKKYCAYFHKSFEYLFASDESIGK